MSDLIFKAIHELEGEETFVPQVNLQNLKLFSQYYKEYYKNNFIDHSFLIFSNDQIVGLVLVHQIAHKLTYPGTGIQADLFIDNSEKEKKIYSQIEDHFQRLAQYNNCKEVIIKDILMNDNLSNFGEILLFRKYQSDLSFEMNIDFECFNKEDYFKNIRKSYKSLINWGKKNLHLQLLNRSNLNQEYFLKIKEFHIKTSGRQTRSDQTWDIQYQQIAEGHGELILAYLGEQLVAGSLFLDQNNTCIYATGVYERDLFEYSISHYPMFYGICRAFERGTTKKVFLGLFESNVVDQKLYNIQYFKKGFCPSLKPVILWRKTIQP